MIPGFSLEIGFWLQALSIGLAVIGTSECAAAVGVPIPTADTSDPGGTVRQ